MLRTFFDMCQIGVEMMRDLTMFIVEDTFLEEPCMDAFDTLYNIFE